MGTAQINAEETSKRKGIMQVNEWEMGFRNDGFFR